MDSPDQIFFTSDTHFGHKKMLTIRPGFKDLDDHDQWLVTAWNAVVPKNGIVFHLGDVSFASKKRTAEILAALNGDIRLIEGNHDHLNAELRKRFTWIKPYFELRVEREKSKQRIVMCHFPFQVWNEAQYGAWHLHGHSHGNLEPIGRRMDVGIDSPHARLLQRIPFRFEEVADYMLARTFVQHDHHSPEM